LSPEHTRSRLIGLAPCRLSLLAGRGVEERGGLAQVGGGTRDTVDANLETSYVKGPLGLSLRGNFFSTGGYPIIQENQRGVVDIDADPVTRHSLAG